MTWREPPGWRALRQLVLLRDGRVCWLCDGEGADSVDHVVPRRLGGTHDMANLRAAHRSCNGRKGARPVLPRAKVSDRWHS